ncbi:MAG: hypothetical protein WBD27_11805, partial [Pyrinomonadaceae bacterium]
LNLVARRPGAIQTHFAPPDDHVGRGASPASGAFLESACAGQSAKQSLARATLLNETYAGVKRGSSQMAAFVVKLPRNCVRSRNGR